MNPTSSRATATAATAARLPQLVRRRVVGAERPVAWLAAAAVVAFVFCGLLAATAVGTLTSARELADLHATILASANPVDVVSTDRHTVKPWFEGRLPFAFDIPELAGTPFRVIGGRVDHAHEQPVAYVMIGKGSQKLSLFVARRAAVAQRAPLRERDVAHQRSVVRARRRRGAERSGGDAAAVPKSARANANQRARKERGRVGMS
jgi:anti-sigma factor RsiW